MSRPKLTDEERAARKEEHREQLRREKEEKRNEQRRAGRARVDEVRDTGELVEGGEISRGDGRSPIDDGAPPPSMARWYPPVLVDRASHPLTTTEMVQFLEEYARTGAKMRSCYSIGRSWSTIQRHLKDDPVFAEQYRLAAEYFNESLTSEITRRGRDGVLKPVFSPALGCEIGVERQYSDRMLEVEAKRRMPTEYRENVSLDVNDQRPHVLVIVPPAATMADWNARRDSYLEKKAAEQQRLIGGSAIDVTPKPAGAVPTGPGTAQRS